MSNDERMNPNEGSSEEDKAKGLGSILHGFFVRRHFGPQDHLKPQRWNWPYFVRPLDQRPEAVEPQRTRQRSLGLRFFFLDGVFATISENFYASFVVLFALAYGATNGQIGLLTAAANLLGTLSLFPGARAAERAKSRKAVILVTGGGIGRIMLLGMAILPLFSPSPGIAILSIIVLNGIRAFMSNFSNPGWTSLVADLVLPRIRGRYFSRRNQAMELSALAVAPLAGLIIRKVTGADPYLGYEIVFVLAFAFGVVSTLSFAGIPEPKVNRKPPEKAERLNLLGTLKINPVFTGFVASTFIWSLAIQIGGPFFNVYLVTGLGGTAVTVGISAGVTSVASLIGQFVFGRMIDRRGEISVMKWAGIFIPILPVFWVFMHSPEQVYIVSFLGGFLWAGYNLASFNLLLHVTNEHDRPRMVAFFQTVVFTSAVIGPLLGGYLLDLIGFKMIFAISGAGRLVGIALFFLLVAARMKGRR